MKRALPAVAHLGIQVSDLDAACTFYQQILGIEKIPMMEGALGPMAFIVLNRFELVLHHIPGASVEKRNKLDHFGLEVADLEAAFERAKVLGATTSEIHKSLQWRQFNCVDPDGYPFHVMSRGQESATG